MQKLSNHKVQHQRYLPVTFIYKLFLYKNAIRRLSPRLFSLFLFLISLLLPAWVLAIKNDDMTQYQQKLEKLQKSISRVQQHLHGNRRQRSNIITELHNLEQNISKNTDLLKSLQDRYLSILEHRQRLQKKLQTLNRHLQTQRSVLIEQMRSAYRMGQQQQIKLLLNQQDPAKIGRILSYFSYLNRARQQQIQHFLQMIQQQRHIEAALTKTLLAQNAALKAQKQKERLRQQQRLQHKQLVARLNRRIQNQESTLSSLKASRSRIENLLKSLGELLADIPTNPAETKPFKTRKGNLAWPLKGPFLARFGQPKEQGRLHWKGVLIGADYGTPVHVISHGRIAFSDWLQGYGFIIIVDHGNGYMSLYGHCESLLKQAGDWVQTGDIIATAGASGGQTRSGLYFEIRSRGKPVNPAKWCRKPGKH